MSEYSDMNMLPTPEEQFESLQRLHALTMFELAALLEKAAASDEWKRKYELAAERAKAFAETADAESEKYDALLPLAKDLEAALRDLVSALPAECSCHEGYTTREKNLGYRFKDPNCIYCDLEDELTAAKNLKQRADQALGPTGGTS